MNNKEKILTILFQNPTYEFHIRELARKSKLHPNTVISITNSLVKEGLVSKINKKHLVIVKSNSEKVNFTRKKRLFNLSQIYSSGLVDYLINHYQNPQSIVLIGSYSRGEDIEISDIDIVIMTDLKKITNIEKYERILKRRLHLLYVNEKNISKEFHTSMINGIVLHGYLE